LALAAQKLSSAQLESILTLLVGLLAYSPTNHQDWNLLCAPIFKHQDDKIQGYDLLALALIRNAAQVNCRVMETLLGMMGLRKGGQSAILGNPECFRSLFVRHQLCEYIPLESVASLLQALALSLAKPFRNENFASLRSIDLIPWLLSIAVKFCPPSGIETSMSSDVRLDVMEKLMDLFRTLLVGQLVSSELVDICSFLVELCPPSHVLVLDSKRVSSAYSTARPRSMFARAPERTLSNSDQQYSFSKFESTHGFRLRNVFLQMLLEVVITGVDLELKRTEQKDNGADIRVVAESFLDQVCPLFFLSVHYIM
jgi:hypothetical protein